MYLVLHSPASLVLLASIAIAVPFPHVTKPSRDLTAQDVAAITTVYEFPNTTWVENVAVRRNGNLLTTIIGRPEIWDVKPSTHTAELVYAFPDPVNSVLGIAEVEPDVFAVAAGHFITTNSSGVQGTWSIWSIDLSQGRHDHWWHGPAPSSKRDVFAKVEKVTDMPDAIFLNGLTVLPTQASTILVADSALGIVYSVNIATATYSIVLDEQAFQPNPDAIFTLGINGIHTAQGPDGAVYLYFTNSFAPPLLGRVKLTATGTAAAPVETILARGDWPLNLNFQADDFALDGKGSAWVAGDPSGDLFEVTLETGVVSRYVGGGNSTLVAGDTAAAFGRGGEREILYVVTNGGLAYPADGVVGGKVLAVDVAEL